MVTAALLAIGLFVCQAQSQLCGPGLFSGLLGFENGLFGPGLQLGPLAAPSCGQTTPSCGVPGPPYGIPAQTPSCGIQVPPCGIQVPPCGIQVPPCGRQVPPCGIQGPSCGIPTPSCNIQVPNGITMPACGIQTPPCNIQVPNSISLPQCGIQTPSCNIQTPPCNIQTPPCNIQVPSGIQVPQCGIQVPQCGIQVPSCGISLPSFGLQAPTINNIAPTLIPNQPCGQCSFIPNQNCGQCSSFGQAIAPVPPVCGQNSVVTVIDNTLANSLANALQLLIVSNLLESTLTPCSNSLTYPQIETPINPFGNVIEIVAPDYCSCNQVEPVYEIPCYQEPFVSYAPCAEVNSCGPVFPDVFDNYGINPYASFGCSENYGLVSSFPNSYGCSENIGFVSPYANSFGCSDNFAPVSPFASNFGCMDSIFSPTVAEVLFPAEIPAQLTCNFGYMPNNVPCVSMNVEPLPFQY